MSPFRMKLILVPTDYSENARRALRYALDLAGVFSARIVLLHVLDTRIVDNIYHIHQLTPANARAEMRRLAAAATKKLLSEFEEPGVEIEVRYEVGIPPVAIQSIAAEIDADLIVIGTRGVTALDQLLYGSTAEGVVRGAPCPVLTVNL